MEWPYRRFLKAYDAFQRRRLSEQWEQRKLLHVSALHANMGFGGDGSSEALQNLEQHYDEVIALIWNGESSEHQQAEDKVWEGDFMNAARRSMAAARSPILPGEKQIQALPA